MRTLNNGEQAMKLLTETSSLMNINNTNAVMMAAILQLQPMQCMAHKRNLFTQWFLRLRQHITKI